AGHREDEAAWNLRHLPAFVREQAQQNLLRDIFGARRIGEAPRVRQHRGPHLRADGLDRLAGNLSRHTRPPSPVPTIGREPRSGARAAGTKPSAYPPAARSGASPHVSACDREDHHDPTELRGQSFYRGSSYLTLKCKG